MQSQLFIKLIQRKLSAKLLLIVGLFSLAAMIRFSFDNFLFLQSQGISGLSVFNEVLIPLAGLIVLLQIITTILHCTLLTSGFYQKGQGFLIRHSASQPSQIIGSIFWVISRYSLIYLGIFLGVIFALAGLTNFDWMRIASLLLGMLLAVLSFNLAAIIVSLRITKLILNLVILSSITLLLLTLDFMLLDWQVEHWWRGLFLPLLNFREGIISLADSLHYLFLICALFALACWQVSFHFARKRNLFIGLLMLMASFAVAQITVNFDVTSSQRNSLSKQIAEQINSMGEPLKFIAVVNDSSTREEIQRGFAILQSTVPGSELEFRSRQSLGPEFNHAGEFIQLNIGELSQSIAYPFEQPIKVVIESALQSMVVRKSHWITFVEGHGEASPFGKKTSDLKALYHELKAMGWPIALQDLTNSEGISSNTKLVVVAASKFPWLPGEDAKLLRYLKNGGNLLLLVDPDSELPDSIEKFIGISRIPGTLVDWNGYQAGTPHPAISIVQQHTDHPVVASLDSILAFPWSSGLSLPPSTEDFEYLPIVATHSAVWNELNVDAEKLSFDEDQGELQQSFVVAASRTNLQNKQKIVVIGDSHFASDSAINNYANKQFSLNLFSWLADQEVAKLANVRASDAHIEPDQTLHWLIRWGYGVF
ncbi:MAG: hypothetical protein OQJ89_02205, partial [Kangiellaceae bacterium]|nr:hypothetical protein [Kangiellaceae bacterium]